MQPVTCLLQRSSSGAYRRPSGTIHTISFCFSSQGVSLAGKDRERGPHCDSGARTETQARRHACTSHGWKTGKNPQSVISELYGGVLTLSTEKCKRIHFVTLAGARRLCAFHPR